VKKNLVRFFSERKDFSKSSPFMNFMFFMVEFFRRD